MRDRDPSIETLRAAADEVARSLPARSTRPGRRPPWRWVAAAVACGLLVLTPVLIAHFRDEAPVEVEVFRVEGRDVRAKVVDDAEAGAIVVRPLPQNRTPALATTGDLR